MNTKLRNILITAGLAVGAVGSGAAAFAQTTDTTPSTSDQPAATAPAPDQQAPGCDQKGPKGDGPDREALATKLGVTVDQLQAAHQAAHEAVDAELGQPERPTTPPSTDEERAAIEEQMKARRTLVDQKVAEQLGISVDQLTQARQELAKEKVAERLASGEITQEQADEMNAKIDSGELPGPRGPRGPHGPRGERGERPANAPADAPVAPAGA